MGQENYDEAGILNPKGPPNWWEVALMFCPIYTAWRFLLHLETVEKVADSK